MDNNDLANKNAKHKFDVLYKIWLGRWFLVQTFEEKDENLEQDIREIKGLLSDEGE